MYTPFVLVGMLITDGVWGCGVGEDVCGGGGGVDIHFSISSPTSLKSDDGKTGGRVDIILFI